jgi:hypothetical protein
MSAGLAVIFAGLVLAGGDPDNVPSAVVPPPAEYHFDVRMARGEIYNPWTLSSDAVELRSLGGRD